MPSNLLQEFRVSITAGVVLDKLNLAKGDAWTMAAHLSNNKRYPSFSALLWSMPLLGSCQLMIQNYQMGEPHAYGVIVGDGQKVSAINPLLSEWLFNRRTIPTGTCVFGTLSYDGSARWQHPSGDLARLSRRRDIYAMTGLPITVLLLGFLGLRSSISYLSPLFLIFPYLATVVSNLYLASQSQNLWAGFTSDIEKVQILILAPGDRWATLSGPRNLIKIITTGSHIDQQPSLMRNSGQYLLVAVLLSVGFLKSATLLDGVYIGCAFCLTTTVAWVRTLVFGQRTTIRGVSVLYAGQKAYRRRADLIEELSDKGKSDAWAYDSNLLTRRFISDRPTSLVTDH